MSNALKERVVAMAACHRAWACTLLSGRHSGPSERPRTWPKAPAPATAASARLRQRPTLEVGADPARNASAVATATPATAWVGIDQRGNPPTIPASGTNPRVTAGTDRPDTRAASANTTDVNSEMRLASCK